MAFAVFGNIHMGSWKLPILSDLQYIQRIPQRICRYSNKWELINIVWFHKRSLRLLLLKCLSILNPYTSFWQSWPPHWQHMVWSAKGLFTCLLYVLFLSYDVFMLLSTLTQNSFLLKLILFFERILFNLRCLNRLRWLMAYYHSATCGVLFAKTISKLFSRNTFIKRNGFHAMFALHWTVPQRLILPSPLLNLGLHKAHSFWVLWEVIRGRIVCIILSIMTKLMHKSVH